MILIPFAQWYEQLEERFGVDVRNWTFRCPKCGTRQNAWTYIHHRVVPRPAYKVCVGRWVEGIGACKYTTADAAGGLIAIPEIVVQMPNGRRQAVFPMADSVPAIDTDLPWYLQPKEPPRRFGRRPRPRGGVGPAGDWEVVELTTDGKHRK